MTEENKTPLQINITEDIILREIDYCDARDIFTTIDSQRKYLGQWLPFVENTKTIEDTLGFIQSVKNRPDDKKEHIFVILYQHKFCGLVGFKDTDRLNRKTEIGYWISEPFQKKGIMTSSVRAMVSFAFNKLKINRIQIKCAVENHPSKKIPERMGFTLEGIEREGEQLSGHIFTDLAVYSLLRREWNQ